MQTMKRYQLIAQTFLQDYGNLRATFLSPAFYFGPLLAFSASRAKETVPREAYDSFTVFVIRGGESPSAEQREARLFPPSRVFAFVPFHLDVRPPTFPQRIASMPTLTREEGVRSASDGKKLRTVDNRPPDSKR